MKKIIIFTLFILFPKPSYAQVNKTLTILPFNYANNTTQPETLLQIRTKFEAFATDLFTWTNGYYNLNVVVNPYVTVTDNLDLNINPSTGVANTCTARSWDSVVIDLNLQNNQPLNGATWVYSPLTFGHCSEYDRGGMMIDGRNFPYFYVLSTPAGDAAIAWAVTCKDDSNNYVPFSNTCTNTQRTFQSITGQGEGSFTCIERELLNSLPANRKKIIAINDILPQTYTITPIEQVPVGDEIQCLTILAFHSPDNWITGITFELHKDGHWQTNGLSGHRTGTSNLYDFTPDGKVVWPGQGGDSTIHFNTSFSYNETMILVGNLKTNGTVDVTISSGSTPPPSPSSCTPSSDPTINVQNLIAPNCDLWNIDPGYWGFIHRNNIEIPGYAEYLSLCNGDVYIKRKHDNSSVYAKWNGSYLINIGSTYPCDGAPPPPPIPDWSFVSGTIEKNKDNMQYRLCITGQPCIIVKQ